MTQTRRCRTLLLLLVALAGQCLAATAQSDPTGQVQGAESTPGPQPIVSGERHVLESQALDETRFADVYLPVSYDLSSTDRTYPVVFVLDGEFLGQTVAGLVAHLASVSRMPEAIVVAVPNNTGQRLSLFPRFLDENGEEFGFGGKEAEYVRFFADELIPYLEDRFRMADFRILIGLSPTAAFTLHTFAQEPDLFQAHVALVAGTTLGYFYSDEESLLDAMAKAARSDLERRRWLYVGHAQSNLDDSPEIDYYRNRLHQRLLRFRRLTLRTEILPGKAYAIALPALISAFEMIFPADDWDPDFRAFLDGEGDADARLGAHFQALSDRYGFEIEPLDDRFFNVNSLRGLARLLGRAERDAEAIRVLERWVRLYPNSPRAYFQLAAALQGAERLDPALETARAGLAKARELDDPDLASYESRFEAFETAILARIEETPD